MKLDLFNCGISEVDVNNIKKDVMSAYDKLFSKTGIGNEYTGWVNYSYDNNKEEYDRIKAISKKIRSDSDAVIVIGTGGSCMGARATISAVNGENYNDFPSNVPKIFFVGNNLNENSLLKAIKIIENYNTSLIVISKSGTTIEPAVAFRLLKNEMYNKYKDKANSRIYVVTDKNKGALRKISEDNSMESFVVPDDIGGRYSVFTPVGLLPIACAGINIDEMMRGLKDAHREFSSNNIEENICLKYAAARYILGKTKDIEILTNYTPDLIYISEWWKQLFGESEGKDGKGLYPASLTYTADLHSMGQLIQDGKKIFFETTLFVDKNGYNICIPNDENDLDNLNYLSGKSVEWINKNAFEATVKAHVDGGVPNIIISIPEINEYYIAKLYYFFMVSCAISAYMLDVNPFNQMGVEEYKNNMKKLLNN